MKNRDRALTRAGVGIRAAASGAGASGVSRLDVRTRENGFRRNPMIFSEARINACVAR